MPKLCDQLRSNSRKYSTSSSVELNEKCNQSSSAKNVLLENLNCLNASGTAALDKKSTLVNDSDTDDDDHDKVEKNSSNEHLRSSINLKTAVKNRLSTIFHRFGCNDAPKESQSSSPPSSIRRNNTFEALTNYFRLRPSRLNNFDDVRDELLLTLRPSSEGCDGENQTKKKGFE